MNKHNKGSASTPKTIATIKIEWNWDLDNESIDLGDFRPGNEGQSTLKGRCKTCWGRLLGRVNEKLTTTGIKCTVCERILEDDDARNEYDRMSKESTLNVLNMYWGHSPKYNKDATFVQKVFPHIERLTKEEFIERVNGSQRDQKKRDYRKLTRSEFPVGTLGYLLLQAKVLIASVESIPREMYTVDIPDFDLLDDSSALVRLSTEGISDDPRFHEDKLIKKVGSTMTAAMMSAFSCELAMKAIRLTLNDNALKSHDLLTLYNDLPRDSKMRISADFAEIESVLERGRETFGKWRYFEKNVGENGIRVMVDTELAVALGKAARVIIDEAELVGLGFSIRVDTEQQVQETSGNRKYRYKQKLNIKGTEMPPK